MVMLRHSAKQQPGVASAVAIQTLTNVILLARATSLWRNGFQLKHRVWVKQQTFMAHRHLDMKPGGSGGFEHIRRHRRQHPSIVVGDVGHKPDISGVAKSWATPAGASQGLWTPRRFSDAPRQHPSSLAPYYCRPPRGPDDITSIRRACNNTPGGALARCPEGRPLLARRRQPFPARGRRLFSILRPLAYIMISTRSSTYNDHRKPAMVAGLRGRHHSFATFGHLLRPPRGMQGEWMVEAPPPQDSEVMAGSTTVGPVSCSRRRRRSNSMMTSRFHLIILAGATTGGLPRRRSLQIANPSGGAKTEGCGGLDLVSGRNWPRALSPPHGGCLDGAGGRWRGPGVEPARSCMGKSSEHGGGGAASLPR